MENIETRLEQYRLRKRRREKFETIKQKLKEFMMLGVKSRQEDESTIVEVEDERPPEKSYSPNNPSSTLDSLEDDNIVISSEDEVASSEANDADPRHESRLLKYTIWVVYLMFWATLYVIAIELQFGLVFLMLSALIGIYLNTRTGPRKSNEISAYSVFNKNCESIDGTLKAEQFEREIRYGAVSVN